MTRLPREIREQVRQRAEFRCEYCRKPEGYSSHGHQVDHIISQKHHGSDDLENLAWACFQCNLCKGTDIAGIDSETGVLAPLFNPRTQSWQKHFQLYDAFITGITATGRVTVDILQINDPDQIETRRVLIESGLWE